jgi:hypothetical protein
MSLYMRHRDLGFRYVDKSLQYQTYTPVAVGIRQEALRLGGLEFIARTSPVHAKLPEFDHSGHIRVNERLLLSYNTQTGLMTLTMDGAKMTTRTCSRRNVIDNFVYSICSIRI